MEDIKIAHFGNMANDGFHVVKALQDMNVNCDLHIGYPQHVCGYPQWETCDLGLDDIGDPYNPDWGAVNRDFKMPRWIHWVPLKQTYRHNPLRLLGFLPLFPAWPLLWRYRYVTRGLIWYVRHGLRRINPILELMAEYDLLVVHVGFALQAYRTKVPYITFDAGAIRYMRAYGIFPYQQARMSTLEDSYRKAKHIMVTNPDTLDLFRKYKFRNYSFMPFLIDTDRYKPIKIKEDLPHEHGHACMCEHVILHPTRQHWSEKGNWLAVQAFAKFHKEYPDSMLALVDWSVDRKRTRALVKKLDLTKNIVYLGLMSKPRLIKWFNKATVMLDQFLLGSYGTNAPECMSCGTPVIMYLSHKHMLETFGKMPPVLNASSTEQIYKEMLKCTDKTFRRKQGELSREWVLNQHSAKVVAQKHLAIYNKVLMNMKL